MSDAEESEKRRLYTLIYSYLVRRALCGLTPKSLNKTFARLTRQMIASGVSVESFKAGFADQRGDAVRFPDDAELRAAIQSKPAYHMLSRKDRLAELLWDLEIATRLALKNRNDESALVAKYRDYRVILCIHWGRCPVRR